VGFFADDDKQSNGLNGQKSGAATIIAQGTKIKGEITIDCHLHVDGELEGIVRSKNTVMIGKNGLISGEIYANKLVISGKFQGTTQSDTVEILPLGRFEGIITASELVIEKKGVFIGESKLKDNSSALQSPSKINIKNDSSKPI